MKNTRNKIKPSTGDKLSTVIKWVVFVLLLVYVISIIAVLGWGLLTSLKSKNDFQYNDNLLGFPNLDEDDPFNSVEQFFKLENYKSFFKDFRITNDNHSESFEVWFGTQNRVTTVDADFWEMLGNSILYALGNSLLQTLVITVTAYLCAKYDFRLSKILYTTVIVIMALPIVGAYPAEITLLRDLNLYDSWIGNFIQKFAFVGMYFLVFYEHFAGMSNTYRDAAEIDGASHWTVMTRVYLPLASKMFGSVVLVRFVFFWNDYSAIRMYMRTHPTLSYGIFYNTIAKPMAGGLPVQVAACMVLAIPVLIIFILLNNKIMGNMTLGGLKE